MDDCAILHDRGFKAALVSLVEIPGGRGNWECVQNVPDSHTKPVHLMFFAFPDKTLSLPADQ